MRYASLIVEILLAGYIVRESFRALPLYRQLKREIAIGHADARSRMYRQILAFQGITAVLALSALRFDWSQLTPHSLNLADSPLVQWLYHHEQLVRGEVGGMFIGAMLGIVGAIALRLRRNRRGGKPAATVRESRVSRWLPDFSAMLPVTTRERLLFAAVALSAGICEEIVFRGWLLAALHGQLGLQGGWLILIAAGIFGLAHAYQKVSGVALTGLLGAVFCLLYIVTGSLLLPIILHVFIDIRFALLPAPRAQEPEGLETVATISARG